jgi:hypothetical protein
MHAKQKARLPVGQSVPVDAPITIQKFKIKVKRVIDF